MRDIATTPAATLTRARRIALDAGLRYVYTGNVRDVEGGTTRCPGCGDPVVVRDWYAIHQYALDASGRCRRCGTQLPGIFKGAASEWGPRRLPVVLAQLSP
jgi:pyruvate formate lyase activating enzyme